MEAVFTYFWLASLNTQKHEVFIVRQFELLCFNWMVLPEEGKAVKDKNRKSFCGTWTQHKKVTQLNFNDQEKQLQRT